MRKPFASRPVNPRYGNNHVDAHFLDALEGDDAETLARILELHGKQKFTLILPHSVKAEIEHESTPAHVKKRAQEFIFTEPVELTPPEIERVERARALMRGNAKSGKHDADAFHIAEAAKYGGRYFITKDRRILKKKDEISELFGIRIVTPADFLDVYERSAE